MKLPPLAALALTATALAAPAFATTVVAGRVSANAQASLGSDPSPGDPRHADLVGVPATLSADSRFDTARGGDSIAVIGDVSAQWASADLGSLTVHNAWQVDLPATDILSAQVAAAPILAGDPDWSYKFVAQADGAFSVDYSIVTSGDVLGFGAWDAIVLDSGGLNQSTRLANFADDPGVVAGTFTRALLAGHTYTISLSSLDSIGIGGAPGKHFTGGDDASFSWVITSVAAGVPEPSTWALTIAGFGLIGTALRRRRAVSLA